MKLMLPLTGNDSFGKEDFSGDIVVRLSFTERIAPTDITEICENQPTVIISN